MRLCVFVPTVAAVVVLAITGCSSGGDGSGAPPATPAASDTPATASGDGVAATPAAARAASLDASLPLRRAVTAAGIREHLDAFQRIARRHGGTRASGTPGYEASARYVERRLRAAGYDVELQEFPYGAYVEWVERARELAPTARTLTVDALEHSPSTPEGGITADVEAVPVDEDESHGCEPADFRARSYEKRVALVKRGVCRFSEKARNAADAGAVAVILYGDSESFAGWSLGTPEEASIPALAASREHGEALAADVARGRVVVSLEIQASSEGTSWNVLADLPGSRDDAVVVAGGHLDSVDEGPGLNDNASGSSALLEIALHLAEEPPPATVRFAFWGTEELGLVGSRYYASRLSDEKARRIAVYLNFDMLGSTNFARFVYRGTGAASDETDRGSRAVRRLFLDYFRSLGLPAEPIRFGSRSDHVSFRRLDVPTGGLFTGAAEEKSERQARVYGGRAGEPYDPCYHRRCDTTANVDLEVLEQMADAAAHAILTFVTSPELLRR